MAWATAFRSPPAVLQVLLALIVIPAAIFDLRWRRVPNWLTLSGLLLGIGLNTFLFGSAGLWSSLQGLGLAFLIYCPLYLLRGMGAGDVKLMAAVGAVAGPADWLGIFILTSLFGGVAAIILIVAKSRFYKTLDNIRLILVSLASGQAPYAVHPQLDVRGDQGVRLPHAVMICCGALGFLLAASLWAPR
jgi:prepilin peptidase CpaA